MCVRGNFVDELANLAELVEILSAGVVGRLNELMLIHVVFG